MVRVNIIDPILLLDQHLLAEWNEIQMLFGTIVKHPNISWQPQKYKLGKGHINFFKDKVLYLFSRLQRLYKEIVRRDYNVKNPNEIMDFYSPNIDRNFFNNWTPDTEDFDIIKERIFEKFIMKPDWYTYQKQKIDVERYKILLFNN